MPHAVMLVLSALLPVLGGCLAYSDEEPPGTPDDPEDPMVPPTLYDSGGVTVRGRCTSGCAEGKRRCEAEAGRNYDSCVGGCFENPYNSYCECCYCLSAWDSAEIRCENLCTQPESCGESDFEVEINGASLELETACREWDATARCLSYTNEFDVTFDGSDFCPQFALVEDPSLVSVYQCLLESRSCDADCGGPMEDTEGTQRVCEDLASCGQGCNSEQEEFLLGNLGWLRHDVRAALDTCTSLPCSEGRVHCFRKWAVAVSHFVLQPRQY